MSKTKKEPWMCARGHDKRIVGTHKNRQCRECKKMLNAEALKSGRWLGSIQKPICPRGHDKREVGRTPYGRCMECCRQDKRARHRRSQGWAEDTPLEAIQMRGLKEVRQSLGLTQKQFAEISGFSLSYVHNLENGRRRAAKSSQDKILRVVVELKEAQRDRRERLERAGLL